MMNLIKGLAALPMGCCLVIVAQVRVSAIWVKIVMSTLSLLSGAFKANVVIAGINWRLAAPEIDYVLNDAQAEILFVGAEFYDLIEQLVPTLSTVRQIIAIDGGHSEWPDFRQWRDSHSDTDPMLPIDKDDDVVQMYTSGTTGHPKGVQLTNGNYLDLLDQAANGGWGDWENGESTIVAMPIFHVAGANAGVLGLAQGLRNIVIRDVDPVVILDVLEQYRVRYAFFCASCNLISKLDPRSSRSRLF